MDGLIILNKPAGLTSARAVARVKRLLPRGTKVGHAGTLDPFATGVLLLLLGRATKLCERVMDQPKEYQTTIKLGATTATDDLESPEQPTEGAVQITREQIEKVLPKFIGEVLQRPPAFSAMKIGGRRSYDLARKGQAVELAARKVRIYSVEILQHAWPNLQLRIKCGRGTYIRSLARDMGAELRVGGYLTQLCRLRIGHFGIESAVELATLTQQLITERLIPVDSPLIAGA